MEQPWRCGVYGRAICNSHFGLWPCDQTESGLRHIYHSNLATALFEEKNYKGAREQFKIALKLDPDMAHHDGAGGLTAHLLSPEDHARYCFEMARLYAELGDEEDMLHYLTKASEAGFDVLDEMREDNKLSPYRKDPRVILLVKNAQALKDGRAIVDDTASTKGSHAAAFAAELKTNYL